jgi:hypothetical protein
MTREELQNKMAVLLGGRAAEYLVYEHFSTGAADDLAKATDIARAIVTRYGMSPRLGHVAYDRDSRAFVSADLPSPHPQHAVSEETAAQIDGEVRRLVQEAFDRAVAILRARLSLLRRAATRLLDQETLDEAELKALVEADPDRHRDEARGARSRGPSAARIRSGGMRKEDKMKALEDRARPSAAGQEPLDEALEKTFPASDPVALVLPHPKQAGGVIDADGN